MAEKTTKKRKARTKKTAKAAPSSPADGGQAITPEQLVNAVGGVFNYLSGQAVPGNMQSTKTHNEALQSLYVVQQAMIQHFGLDQAQLENSANGSAPEPEAPQAGTPGDRPDVAKLISAKISN